MWFLRLAKSLHKLFQTQFLYATKIKSTFENVVQNTKILDLSAKRWTQQLDQVFSLKYRDFDQLDKTLYSPSGLRDKNSFYCGSLVHRLVLFHKKKKFWI